MIHNSRFNPPTTDLLARGSAAGATRGDFSLAYTMFIDFTVVVLLVVFAFISRHVGSKVAAKIDESMQTAQDYAVCVLTPPPDVFDCDAYKEFFGRYGDVVSVTLALNNGALLDAIGDKKECETRLLETVEGERLLDADAKGYGIELQQPPLYKRALNALSLYSDPLFLWREREALKARVAAAVEHQAKYARVKRVFVIFATEAAQRRCLQDMYSGLLQSVVGGRVIASTKPQTIFHGRALVCEEPVEPSEVIWEVRACGCVGCLSVLPSLWDDRVCCHFGPANTLQPNRTNTQHTHAELPLPLLAAAAALLHLLLLLRRPAAGLLLLAPILFGQEGLALQRRAHLHHQHPPPAHRQVLFHVRRVPPVLLGAADLHPLQARAGAHDQHGRVRYPYT